jgi:hypothetical protein
MPALLAPPYAPNAEMVGIAWVKSLPGMDATKVATVVPGDTSKWSATGFVTVTAVGGSPNIYVPMRHPVVQISAWMVRENSEKAPWGEAQVLAEAIHAAFYDQANLAQTFTWTNYRPAVLHSGYPLQEPRKIPGSAAGYAHVQFDAQLHWTTV